MDSPRATRSNWQLLASRIFSGIAHILVIRGEPHILRFEAADVKGGFARNWRDFVRDWRDKRDKKRRKDIELVLVRGTTGQSPLVQLIMGQVWAGKPPASSGHWKSKI